MLSENSPVQVEKGVVSKRTNLKIFHLVADINIIKQCMACFKDEVNCVKTICDDNDIFVLLTVYVFRQGCKSKVPVEVFDTSRSLIDINDAAKKHAEIVPSLIGAHALSGYDSVSNLYGIGNNTVIRHIKDENLSRGHRNIIAKCL